MFHITIPENGNGMDGPPLHALTIPSRDPSALSPADAIASSLVSPTDTYASSMASMSPTSSHGGPFTPADALRMMSLVQKDAPENVDPEHDVGEMPFDFWSGDSLWLNTSLMPDDFSLTSILPVELGPMQFDAMPQQELSFSGNGACGEWAIENVAYGYDGAAESRMAPAEEHDYDDAPTPGGPDGYAGISMYGHEHMNW